MFGVSFSRRFRSLCVMLVLVLVAVAVQLSRVEGVAWAQVQPEGVGERKAYTFEGQRLTDRLEVKVNPATGNLVVKASDVQIAGTGVDVAVERFYNSLSTVASAQGPGWLLGVGHDVKLDIDGSTVTFQAPSGYRVEFTEAGNGGFSTDDAPGIDASLSRDGSGFALEWKDRQVYRFDSDGRWTAHEDANGNRVTFAYRNKNAPLSQITDTRGRTVDFTYSKGTLVSVRDNAGGRTYAYTYDAAGRLASSAVTTYGLGKDNINLKAETSYGYDAQHRLTSITDPRGNTTGITYHGTSRRVASVVRATGPTTTFTYLSSLEECADEAAAVGETRVDGPRSDVADATVQCFDEHDRQVAAVDAKGHRRTSEYTSNSNLTVLNESGVAGGPATGFTWQQDNLVGVELPTGGVASMDYDDVQSNPHLPTGVRDFATDEADDPTWAYDYDESGNLFRAHNPGEGITFRYCYNGDGTVDRIAPPPHDPGLPEDDDTSTSLCRGHAQGNDTLFGYNANGELTRVDPPGSRGTETFTYDALSRVATRRDGRGVTETYTYDAVDRVVRIDYDAPVGGLSTTSDGEVGTMELIPPDDEDAKRVWITFTYDTNGNLTARSDSTGNDTFSYDALNRMSRESPKAPSANTTYTYDPAGNVTQIRASDQPAAVRYAYDAVNLVSRVTDQKDRTTTFDYDDKGNRTVTAYPNGVTQESRYDDAGRMACTYAYTGSPPAGQDDCPQASTTLLELRDYSHERVGVDTNRLESETDRTGATTTYDYDAISRLTAAATTDTAGASLRSHAYTYDDQGNLTREEVTGSQATDETRSQAYDLDNTLCWAAAGAHTPDCATTPAGAETFAYDATGAMTARRDMTVGYSLRGHTVRITPPGMPDIAMTYSGATQDRRITAGDLRMGYDQTGLSAQGPNNGSSQVWFPRDDSGRLVGMLGASSDAGDVYYLFDRLGSVIATTNMSGAIVERYAYEPYGEQINPRAGDPNPFRYVSGYHDTTTGMIKFGQRYYMPDLARWTQPDPELGNPTDPMTLNPYVYVGCDPINLIDPSGRHSECAEDPSFWWNVGLVTVSTIGLTAGLIATPVTGGMSTAAALSLGTAAVGKYGGLVGLAIQCA